MLSIGRQFSLIERVFADCIYTHDYFRCSLRELSSDKADSHNGILDAKRWYLIYHDVGI